MLDFTEVFIKQRRGFRLYIIMVFAERIHDDNDDFKPVFIFVMLLIIKLLTF